MNFGEVRKARVAKFTLLNSTLGSLGSFKVCSDAKESGLRKATGSYRTYLSLAKITLVPEFAVEDLPLDRTAASVPVLAVKDLPLCRIL